MGKEYEEIKAEISVRISTDSRKSSMSCRWGLRSQISSLMK